MTVTQGFYALVPITITSSNYITSPVAEPDPTRVMGDGTTGEVEWVSGTNYPNQKRVIVSATHRVYRHTVGGVSTTRPDLDPIRWFDEGPTNKWAWADSKAATKTRSTSPAVFVVRPGVFNVIEFFALENVDTIRVEVWDEPAGTLVYDNTIGTEELAGTDPHWGLYFEAPSQGDTLSFTGLPVYPDCEVRITMTSDDTNPVGVGLMGFGSYEFFGTGEIGFEAIYRDYGYSVTDKWGNTVRYPGEKGKDLRGTAFMAVGEANNVDRTIRKLLDSGAVFVPSQLPEDRFLKTWGLLKPSSIRKTSPTTALVNIEVEGYI